MPKFQIVAIIAITSRNMYLSKEVASYRHNLLLHHQGNRIRLSNYYVVVIAMYMLKTISQEKILHLSL